MKATALSTAIADKGLSVKEYVVYPRKLSSEVVRFSKVNPAVRAKESGSSYSATPFRKKYQKQESLQSSATLLKLYMKEINKFPLLSPEQEIEVARRAKAGDQEAYDLLVNSNLRFVVHVARRYSCEESQLMDMISEGNLGLMRAADKFDPERGCHFVSYAVWNIKQAVLTVLKRQSHSIRLPMSQLTALQRLKALQLQVETGFATIDSATAAAMLDREKNKKGLRHSLQVSQEEIRLDADNNGSDGESRFKNIPSDKGIDPFKYVVDRQFQEHLNRCLEQLSPQERVVVSMRYGLGKKAPAPLHKVATYLGLSNEWVRKMEKNAIQKIRCSKLGEELAIYLHST